MMQRYNFEIISGDDVLYREAAVQLSAQTGLWPYVQLIAEEHGSVPGDRIRVTDEAGQIVILIGLSAARPSRSMISTEHQAKAARLAKTVRIRASKKGHPISALGRHKPLRLLRSLHL